MMKIVENLIDKDKIYGITGDDLSKIEDLKTRLYSERSMSGDEMRTWANLLFLILKDNVEELD